MENELEIKFYSVAEAVSYTHLYRHCYCGDRDDNPVWELCSKRVGLYSQSGLSGSRRRYRIDAG